MVAEHKLGSFSDGGSLCLPVFLYRHVGYGNRGVARGGFQGFRNPPLASKNPPSPIFNSDFIPASVMDSRFLEFFVLFYPYNKYSERHCGIYLTNRFHFAVHLYSDNAQMTSKRGENKEVRGS